jgi:hypothetical protein
MGSAFPANNVLELLKEFYAGEVAIVERRPIGELGVLTLEGLNCGVDRFRFCPSD